jgi:hypothetical protein
MRKALTGAAGYVTALLARLVVSGALPLLAAACAHGNAATLPAPPTPHDGGNFLPFYVQQLQQPQQPKDDCGASLLAPCDKGGARIADRADYGCCTDARP